MSWIAMSWIAMSCRHVLDRHERAALAALAVRGSIATPDASVRTFGRKALDTLCGLGLAERIPGRSVHLPDRYAITPDGWTCIYGVGVLDGNDASAHVPLRVWQWPPAPCVPAFRGRIGRLVNA
jgi:hypothetical protein